MSSDDFTSDDIGQMVKQGDIRAFLRSRSQRPEGKREFPDAAPPKSRADGLPVGLWPAHLHRPGCPVFGLPPAGGCASCG